jgi:hypothetical protein
MTTPTQQVSDAQSAGQAVATATPAPVQTPTQIQPPQPAPQEPAQTFGLSAQELARQYSDTKQESLRRKAKIKALKSLDAQRAEELAQTAKERDALKTAAATYEARLTQLNTKRAEDVLVSELRAAGFTESAARLLIPALGKHVVIDAESYDITLNKEDLAKAVAEIKPPQPTTAPAVNGAQRLHSLNAAARTEPTSTQPLTWQDRLRIDAERIAPSKR